MKTLLCLSALWGRMISALLPQSHRGAKVLLALALGIAGPISNLSAQEIYPATPPPVEVVTVRAVDAYASEPCVAAVVDNGMFVISRNVYTNFDQTVYFQLSGTASNGVDYTMPAGNLGSVVIPTGRRAVELPIHALADKIAEGAESVVLRLVPPLCIALSPPPPWCYFVGQPAEATVYIRDCPPATNAVPWVKILRPFEGQNFLTPTDIPIVARTVDPDGYCSKAEFFDGQQSIGTSSVYFFVAPTNGTPVEFEFLWKDVPAGNHYLRVQATDQQGNVGISAPVHVTVGPLHTNRPAEVSVVATEPLAIEGTNCWGWYSLTNHLPTGAVEYTTEIAGSDRPAWWYTNCGPKSAVFTIRRSGPTNESLLVFFRLGGTAVSGTDYEPLPNVLEIPPGFRKANLLVVPIDDPVIEPMETVILELTPPPYANPLPAPYVIVPPARAAVAIVDSSRPRLRPRLLADHCFHLGARAPDGAWYRLERSTNLVHWETLCTNQVIQGELHFLDPDADSANAGFYRALPAEPPAE